MARPGTYVIRDFRSGTGYRCPTLIGLTIEGARHEWTHRYGVRVVTDTYPYNVDYRGQQHEVTWQGFTGAVATNVVNPSPADVVSGFSTVPAGGTPGTELPATAAVTLEVTLAAGSYYLATPDGDRLVTAASEPLYVEIT